MFGFAALVLGIFLQLYPKHLLLKIIAYTTANSCSIHPVEP